MNRLIFGEMDMDCTLDHGLQLGFAPPRETGTARNAAATAGLGRLWRWRLRLDRGSHATPAWPELSSSGHAALDAGLPDCGWRAGKLVEVFTPYAGETDWVLLEPLLAGLAAQGRPLGLVNAPRKVQAAGLADALVGPGLGEVSLTLAPQQHPLEDALAWLGAHSQGALVLWVTELSASAWRALRRAALRSRAFVFVIRPALARWDASPAELQISLLERHSAEHALEIRVQARDCPAASTIRLALPAVRSRVTAARPKLPLKVVRDPHDERRAVLSGTMADVCRELDRMTRMESRPGH
jgi:cell division inhibitor SulA